MTKMMTTINGVRAELCRPEEEEEDGGVMAKRKATTNGMRDMVTADNSTAALHKQGVTAVLVVATVPHAMSGPITPTTMKQTDDAVMVGKIGDERISSTSTQHTNA
jgi:hypothetical protein